MIEYCTINPINGGPETNDIVLKFYAVYIEMTWYTFGGEYSEIYDALMIAWCKHMGLPTDPGTLAKYFRLHLERGIAHLSGTNFIKNLDDLLNLALGEN